MILKISGKLMPCHWDTCGAILSTWIPKFVTFLNAGKTMGCVKVFGIKKITGSITAKIIAGKLNNHGS